jgi:hypothetical protein
MTLRAGMSLKTTIDLSTRNNSLRFRDIRHILGCHKFGKVGGYVVSDDKQKIS